ncbi:MAG: hypothetical protein HY581_07365 [Nitrospirae bacterium]|nr:hypothetical protein [Nitrospirota bacterium]
MRVYPIIRSAVIVASLVLIPWAFAPSVSAEDQPTGQGTQSQKEIKKDTKDERPGIQHETPATGELGKSSEQPMQVPESVEPAGMGTQEFQPTDAERLEFLRMQDEKSALSF